MTKLTDLQLVLLTTAASREDGSLVPLPSSFTAPPSRLRQAVGTLVKRDLAADVAVADTALAYRADGGVNYGAAITDAGRIAIGADLPMATNPIPEMPPAGSLAPEEEAAPEGAAAQQEAATPDSPAPTKSAQVLTLLRRSDGASLAELVSATGWLPHTTRAALTGLRKKGHAITRDKVDGVTRYTIVTVA